VIFDDYYTWDGCAVAVHEFLGSRGLWHRIETVGRAEPTCAVFRKGKTTWSWARAVHLLGQDLALLAANTSGRIILVDDDTVRAQLSPGVPTVPFTERDGLYYGPPADDQTAIRELNRMRLLGAGVIAFAWPSFWWLEHYGGFIEYLGGRGSRIIENDRVIAFALPHPERG